jgi:amino acid transporter
MKKFSIEFKWAIQFSLLSLVWVIVEKSMGLHDEKIAQQAIYTNLFAFLAVTIYYLSLRDKKKNYYLGQMDWKQGTVSGVALTFLISALVPMVQYVAYNYISPTFFDHMIEYSVQSKHMKRAQAEMFFNLNSYTIMAIFNALSMGVITSAIVALLLKTKPQKS